MTSKYPSQRWVTCPICSQTGMQCDTDSEGFSLIKCSNHLCASNQAIDAEFDVDSLDASMDRLDESVRLLGGASEMEKTPFGRDVLDQIKRIFDPSPQSS